MRRVHLRATGRVQGVSFRASTRAEAARLGLTGWVCNRDDGSVWAEAQGDPEAVARLEAWCRVGPPGARVAALDVTEAALVAGESGFEVRRTAAG